MGRIPIGDSSGLASGKTMQFVVRTIGLQVVVFAISYFRSPGYLTPFLNNTTCQIALAVLVLWQVLGLAIMFLTGYRPWKGIVITTFFTLPLLVAPMLGPAVLTIINAMGPVMNSK